MKTIIELKNQVVKMLDVLEDSLNTFFKPLDVSFGVRYLHSEIPAPIFIDCKKLGIGPICVFSLKYDKEIDILNLTLIQLLGENLSQDNVFKLTKEDVENFNHNSIFTSYIQNSILHYILYKHINVSHQAPREDIELDRRLHICVINYIETKYKEHCTPEL